MRTIILLLIIICSIAFADSLNDFVDKFNLSYSGSYSLGKSPECSLNNKIKKIKIDRVSNFGEISLRVIFLDKSNNILTTYFYPFKNAKLDSLDKENHPKDSLLWEHGNYKEVGNTKKLERFTFAKGKISFDTESYTGYNDGFIFSHIGFNTKKSRCNFTKTISQETVPTTKPQRKKAVL